MSKENFTPPAPLKTALLFLVFNRPDTTALVFEAIRKAKPPRLYVAADGPRTNLKGEAKKVAKVRNIASNVDWPCEVKTLFRDENLGCKYAVSSGITWFFEHEDQGIIIEDDCLPSQSFFWFCEELLIKYKNNKNIYTINGNHLPFKVEVEENYYFTAFPSIWGWATWKRVWDQYDVELSKHKIGNKVYRTPYKLINLEWQAYFNLILSGFDTWDFQLVYLCFYNKALSIQSNVNLVSNIGFGVEATHTNTISARANQEYKEINFPLIHPKNIRRSLIQENTYYKNLKIKDITKIILLYRFPILYKNIKTYLLFIYKLRSFYNRLKLKFFN